MLLRSLNHTASCERVSSTVRPASDVFLETQKQMQEPVGIVLQAEHAMLAGQLASALSPHVFGPMSDELLLAAAQHDFGWQKSDEAQMELLPKRSPRPFPALSAEETLASWTACIAHARELNPVTYVLISRHFTFLGSGDPGREEFVRTETKSRREIEDTLSIAETDLSRWGAALGFVDLLSLYLCSGSRAPVEFPLAHPADPASHDAPKTTLCWQGGSPMFSKPVLCPGTRVSLVVRTSNRHDGAIKPLTLTWDFPNG